MNRADGNTGGEGREVWRGDAARETEAPLDLLDRGKMLASHQRHDRPVSACSAGTAGSVDIVGAVGGWIEVYDERHGINVDPPRCDVGGDEHVEPSAAKRGQSPLALALTAVAMDSCRGET